MGAVQHSFAASGERDHELAQHQRRGDIEARVRFVEDEDVRIVQQRSNDHYLLLHALRVRADVLVRRMRQAKQLEQRADLSLEERGWQFAEASDEFEVLDRRLKGVEVGLFRNVAEALAERDWIARSVLTVPVHGASRRFEKPSQHLRRRALPGTVRTKVAHDFTGPNLEADVVDDCSPEEPLHEMPCFEHGASISPLTHLTPEFELRLSALAVR
jgi:hypothetical protein